MWLVGFVVARNLEPAVWQEAQSCGVPLNIPPAWQEAQAAMRCSPTSSKPVVKWSKVEAAAFAAGGAKSAQPSSTSASPAKKNRLRACGGITGGKDVGLNRSDRDSTGVATLPLLRFAGWMDKRLN